MQKKLLLRSPLLEITINRLVQQVIEQHETFSDSVIIGLQPRGKYFANRLKKRLDSILGLEIPIGYLDTTFYSEDFRRKAIPLKIERTEIPFLLEKKKVILVDDVLFTGRTVRSALTAMSEFGRPTSIELLVLIDRKYSRNLPIQADYVGKSVNSIQSQQVLVEWKEQGFETDTIWLITKIDESE